MSADERIATALERIASAVEGMTAPPRVIFIEAGQSEEALRRTMEVAAEAFDVARSGQIREPGR